MTRNKESEDQYEGIVLTPIDIARFKQNKKSKDQYSTPRDCMT